MSRWRVGSLHGVWLALALLCVACAAPRSAPPGPALDARVAQISSAARLAYDNDDLEQARALYREVLSHAGATDDAALAADAAYSVAVCEIGLRHYDAAETLLRQADYDARRAGMDRAQIALLRAKVANLRDRLPQARSLIDTLLGDAVPPALRVQALVLRGQIESDGGDHVAARGTLLEVDTVVAASRADLAPSVAADLAKLEGVLARAGGEMAVAAARFDAEVELLRQARRFRDMGYALARAADAFLAAGQPASAADRYYRAARTLDGRGETAAARGLLASSMAAADRANDATARDNAELLLAEINRRGAP